jgi:hypothetical protein
MGITLGMGPHWPMGLYHDLVAVIDEEEPSVGMWGERKGQRP